MTNPFRFGDKVALKSAPAEMGVVVGWGAGVNVKDATELLVQWEGYEDDYHEVSDLQHWDAMQWEERSEKVDGIDPQYVGQKGDWSALVSSRVWASQQNRCIIHEWHLQVWNRKDPKAFTVDTWYDGHDGYPSPEVAKVIAENFIDREIALKALKDNAQ